MNLPPLEDVVSPGKKSKAKLPDFEKTLANWVRNQQKKGVSVSDEDLKKQARMFSFSRSDQALVSSASWLDKFKHKNQLGRYADSVDSSASQTVSPLASPASSTDLKLPGPIMEEMEPKTEVDLFDFDPRSPQDGLDSQVVVSPMSSPAQEDDDEMMDLPVVQRMQTNSNTLRQRSQTLPHLGDYSKPSSRPRTASTEKPPMSRAMTASLTSQSHVDPMATIKRHKSVPDIHEEVGQIHFSPMQPPPIPYPSESNSPISIPLSPAEDDNIKALHAIKKLLQENPGVADPDDYLAIGKLMEKMKLLRSPTPGTASLSVYDSKGRKRQYMAVS
jgi:hypothetical protein